jgi:hypothetical protein
LSLPNGLIEFEHLETADSVGDVLSMWFWLRDSIDCKDAGKTLGHSGNGGIHDIINEHRLGLDVIYIQAKH